MTTEISFVQTALNVSSSPVNTGFMPSLIDHSTPYGDTWVVTAMSSSKRDLETSSISDTLANVSQTTESSEALLLDNSDLSDWNSDSPHDQSTFTPMFSSSGYNTPYHQRQFLSPPLHAPTPTQYLPQSYSLPPSFEDLQANEFVS